jgi:hypothetical protein
MAKDYDMLAREADEGCDFDFLAKPGRTEEPEIH